MGSLLPRRQSVTEEDTADAYNQFLEQQKVPFTNIQITQSERKLCGTTLKPKEMNIFCCVGDNAERYCLCDTIKPILWLSQYFGIIPLALVHQVNKNGKEERSCQLVFRWCSVPAVFSTILILFFVAIKPFSYLEIRDRMSNFYTGTDLYTFTFQTLAMVFETTIIISAGRFYKEKFTKGWNALNEVFHAICDSTGDLRRIKIASYTAALLIIVETVTFFCYAMGSSIRSIGFYQTCFGLFLGTFIITLTLIIPYILSTLFLFICLLIRSHYLKIAEMLTSIMAKNKLASPKLYTKIDCMRVLHEQLCQAVGFFEEFFGIQVLLTLCTCCFTVTTGAYACILLGEGISSPLGQHLTGAWVMQLYCASIFMLLILISGQLVTNAAVSPASVLNAIPLTEMDARSQTQVTAFLNKISAFPTKMSAVKVTTISTTFLASAATNITTYLLVLMQFKLSLESYQAKTANATDLAVIGSNYSVFV